MDITLQLKKKTPNTPVEEVGDIINVWETTGEDVTFGGKFLYVHITGVPDISNAKKKRLRDMLVEQDWVGGTDTELEMDHLPGPTLRNSRRWHIPRGALPVSARRKLREDGEITVTWTKAKPYIRRKLE